MDPKAIRKKIEALINKADADELRRIYLILKAFLEP